MADKVPKSSLISEGLWVLSFGFVSMYVLRTKEGLIGFDAGMRAGSARAEFRKLGLDPGRVVSVFLTHSDRDHTGGLAAFPEASVYMSRDEVAMTDHSTPRLFGFMYNKALRVKYEAVSDSQVVATGSARVQCIATPGHTTGSMSFLVDGSILIVGDILNLDKGKAVMDREFINIDKARRGESIRKLARLHGVTHLCTMHSGYTRDFPNAMQDWMT
jgi:hydroxyacylglutathione hydrolase